MDTILLFADWYEPGYKAGGPIRSCVNFVRQMSSDYRICVFTSDRDLGSTTPYAGILTDKWIQTAENVSVFYCSSGNLRWKTIRAEMQRMQPGFIYLNSMFSAKFTILPLLISRRYNYSGSVVLAPRGMLRESAIKFKPFKKKVFLTGLRWLGFHRRVRFHASDQTEVGDTRRFFGPGVQVSEIPIFPAAFPTSRKIPDKVRGQVSLIFVGRVHPIKNLDFLIRVLGLVRASVTLTVIGGIEDAPFWEKCCQAIRELPPHISVNYGGEVPNQELPAILEKYHIFALPTRGENFGHAIFEAFALGKPALISDQTPWRNLRESHAGWDLPLDRPDLFSEAIEEAAEFDGREYEAWSAGALDFARGYVSRMNVKQQYRQLFS